MTRESQIREMYAEGERRWPALALSYETYLRHCAPLFGDDIPDEELRSHGADLYLCCACASGDPIALRLFDQETSTVVSTAIARVCRDPEFVQETLQEFRKKLLSGTENRLARYQGRGPLQAWLRVAATRLAFDRSKAERARALRNADFADSLLDQQAGPESTLIRAQYCEPFREALDRALSALPSRQRNLLRMHVVGRCSIDQIGRAYQVHRATAARWLEQTRGQLRTAIQAELKLQGTALSESEFNSVARVVGGELDIAIPPESANAQQGDTVPSN